MAKEENKIVDRLFESRLKDATMAPPAGLWDSIASDLENDRLRRKVAMWRWVAAATILLFLGFGSWTLVHFTSVDHHDERFATSSGNSHLHVPGRSLAAVPEVKCKEEAPTELASAAQLTPESIEVVTNAVNTARRERMTMVRKAAAMPVTTTLAALESRDPGQINPSGTVPAISRRHISDVPKPNFVTASFADASSMMENEDAPRHRGRDREIIAWDANDKKEREKSKLKWAIGGTFSPDVAFATQIPVTGSGAKTTQPSLPDDAANSSRRLSDPVATFSTGIRAAVDLNERMALRSGILYTRRTGSQTELSSSFGKQESFANNFSVDYLEIPVSFQYNLVKGKVFDYYVSSGLAGNLMLGYQQELQTSTGRIASKKVSNKGQAFTPAQASLLLSTGMQYKAFERLSINLEPGMRYGFLTNEYAFSREDPVSLSLMSSLNFHF